MTGIEKGLAAGARVAPKRRNLWKPIGYERAGYLIAKIENTETGVVERVIENAGDLIYWELGRGTDGDVRAYSVKGALKKIAKAMLNKNADWYYDAHSEAPKWVRGGTENPEPKERPRRTRRKR